ncbi:hypothetical protein PHYPO_G00046390 [Pangasianodon hypophthalmus]|uniref:Integrase zinc-binding domain-containing protein n=1 Tax=Pangasianodon hypophthalmus TaxID=310915 RepID=A0A5N5MGG0_PANHP|nr:hypothetical protein PHYPO_G00046390 [Pangasianodon hypophthalmus]
MGIVSIGEKLSPPLRIPLNAETLMDECTEEISCDAVGATVHLLGLQSEETAAWSMAISVEDVFVSQDTSIVLLAPGQIRQDQEEDPHIGPVLQCMLSRVRPSFHELEGFSAQSLCLARELDKLEVDEQGILWRKITHRKQLVIPDKHKSTELRELHDQMGYQGTNRMISLIRDCFFSPYMLREM